MTQETKQERVITSAESLVVFSGTAQPTQGGAGAKKAVTELTDTDLQAVTGGGGRGGLGGDIPR